MKLRIRARNNSAGVAWIVIGGKRRTSADPALGSQWLISCLTFVERVFGKDSIYYDELKGLHPKVFSTEGWVAVEKVIGVLKAAKDDYENGYLSETQTLIAAEVFEDFLEQSEHLLNQGYFTAAAVIAGSVLEDGLRKLCLRKGITLSTKPKLDMMNADLAKTGVYNLLKQKQITALADLRNKAAHGLGGFTKEDVDSMINDVRRFMRDYFS
ncbi:MAG: HEPN domain-containing protein [Acidobacteria bacterium]|nr:HEPN domain-containing protein [Acidobacteriota bacterium]